MFIRINPVLKSKFKRFRQIKRGYISFILFLIVFFLSLVAELFINNKALMVKYKGDYFFPIFSEVLPGTTFGLNYKYETNYRELKKKFQQKRLQGKVNQDNYNYVVLPFIPYNAFENDLIENEYPPYAPSWGQRHILGTDTTGRDIFARLVYGFRIAIIFSLLLLLFNYIIGISVGCIMGYFGGIFDLIFQRIIEVWTAIPFFYVIIIISSIIVPNFFTLILIMAFFGWISMTWYMRTATYKEKSREYVVAAKALGASNTRVIFYHILPNVISLIVTFIPFSISSGIVALTSLDYLGFGLPPPTPSWGELLKQGTNNLESGWIVISVILAMVLILVMVTFIGEAIREAFDPKRHTIYE